jgi:hypothetical protein
MAGQIARQVIDLWYPRHADANIDCVVRDRRPDLGTFREVGFIGATAKMESIE